MHAPLAHNSTLKALIEQVKKKKIDVLMTKEAT